MPTLYLVRHGRAAAGWDSDPDPGLDETGHAQARAMAQSVGALGPLSIAVSPMRRTRETAAPLEMEWASEAVVEPRISEIASPTSDLKARGDWLRQIAAQSWAEQDAALRDWWEALLSALLEPSEDTVFVTHFIAINAAVGRALGDDRVVHFRPDYCSVTVLRNEGGRLTLEQRGAEAQTRVL